LKAKAGVPQTAGFPAKKLKEALGVLSKRKQKVLLFLGNGINELSRNLSTEAMVGNFVKESARADPREYEEKKKTIRVLAQALEGGGPAPDMTDFMSEFKVLKQLRDDFVSYVIEACCRESPTENHELTNLLCTLLQKHGGGGHQVAVFTTNYDNLLERSYLGYYGPRRAAFAQRRHIFWHLGPGHDSQLLRPRYSLEVALAKNTYPVVPLHGSICVCRCPGCNRVLTSEAAALERKRCVYCGEEIPRVVVPTTEGEADKKSLSRFEDWIAYSSLVLFVGYSFGDPHIIERIKNGLHRNVTRPGFRLVNLCHCVAPFQEMAPSKAAAAVDLTMDITEGLMQLSTIVGSAERGDLGKVVASIKESLTYLRQANATGTAPMRYGHRAWRK
jgi:NAD-dependent SIR2 family protein deacetylase